MEYNHGGWLGTGWQVSMVKSMLVRVNGRLLGLAREGEGAMRCLAGLALMQKLLEGQTGGRRMRMDRGQRDGRLTNDTEDLSQEQQNTEEGRKPSSPTQARKRGNSRGGGMKKRLGSE